MRMILTVGQTTLLSCGLVFFFFFSGGVSSFARLLMVWFEISITLL
jgi:hypothetical protein